MKPQNLLLLTLLTPGCLLEEITPCQSDNDCPRGEYCHQGTFTGCLPLTSAPDGGPSGDGGTSSCPGTPCPSGTECTDEGTCRDPEASLCGYYLPGDTKGGEMCKLSAGPYYLGCNDGPLCLPQDQGDPTPLVSATLSSDTYIDRHEVSNERFQAYLDATGDTPPLCSDPDPLCCTEAEYAGYIIWDINARTLADPVLAPHPVVCVTAEQAEAFCAWEGKSLPTEAQWEAAARAGADRVFPWDTPGTAYELPLVVTEASCKGDGEALQCLYTLADPAQIPHPCPIEGFQCTETVPVHELALGASVGGVTHLSGNAAEWTADVFHASHGGCESSCEDPSVSTDQASIDADHRAVRGGSWASTAPHEIATWSRVAIQKDTRSRSIGFRCVHAR